MSESRRSLTGADLRGVLLGGRYRLEALVGAGATAQVYAALDLRLRRRVAVKVVHASAPDDDQRARLMQEALVGASLSHPNLTPVLDLGEEALAPDDARLYVVMLLLEGETLRQVILGGAIGWRRALALVQHLLAGLGALHRAGVIHRDLKPENCLVIRQGGR
ncbi:MAG: protein kinase, partial [Myxococcales bacterium]|nr:protein kinase [Myxococcales bacterium]